MIRVKIIKTNKSIVRSVITRREVLNVKQIIKLKQTSRRVLPWLLHASENPGHIPTQCREQIEPSWPS